MKKFLILLVLFFAFPTMSYAATKVQLNGELIDFTDENGRKVEAQIINDRTMVPLRKIFELLGCEVEWDGANQRITATKEDIKIELQINRKTAKKTKAGVTTEIMLDSAPVIINDRTLVPMRFIAESLNKQVGWDASNTTAIIIDYTYFTNTLKQKAPAFYYFLQNGVSSSNIVLVRNFADQEGKDTVNITCNISETVSGNQTKQNLQMTFAGDNPLMQDIVKEKWNNVSAEIVFGKDEFTYRSSGVFQKVLDTTTNRRYEGIGNADTSLEEFFRLLVNLDEKKMTIQSFSEIQKEFNQLCDLVDSTNTSENTERGTRYTWNFHTKSLTDQNAKMQYFDFTKLDNILWDHAYSRTYHFLNQKIFHYDVKQDELFYDTSSIVLDGKISVVENGGKIVEHQIDVTYQSNNVYQEEISYHFTANSI